MDNTMLNVLGRICGLSAEEKEILQATYEAALTEKPVELQSISAKVEKAITEFLNGEHRIYQRAHKSKKLKDYEIECEIEIYNVTYTLFRARIGSYSDKPYLAAEWASETRKYGYRNQFYGQYPDVLMNYYERINNRLETMAYLKSTAHDPGHILYASDCIEDSRDTSDYTGQILVLLPYRLCDGYQYADLQFYYAIDGPGCDPSVDFMWTDSAWINGVLLMTGEKWIVGRQSTAGIIKPELLPAWAAEKVKEIEADAALAPAGRN